MVSRLVISVCGLCLCLSSSLTPAFAQIRYEYDALGRLVSVIHPDGKQTIYAYDAAGNRTAKTIHGTVQNHTPEAGDDTYVIDEATSGEWDPRINDTDADSHPLTITNVTQAKFGAVEITQSGTHVRYTPQTGFIGEDDFTYTVDDGQGTYDTSHVSVTINNVPPAANPDTIPVNENSNITFDPRANDSDPTGQPVTITAVTEPGNGVAEIVNAGSGIKYTPDADYFGPDSFDYTITGYHNDTDTASVAVTVNSTNQPPAAAGDSIAVTAGESLAFDPRTNDSDPDNDPITITAKTNGSKGTVMILGGGAQVSYAADPGTSGADSFTYTISDPESATSIATVNVDIAPGNLPPTAVNDGPYNVGSQTILIIDPRTNDSDPNGDALEIISSTNGSVMTTTIVDGRTKIKMTAGFVFEIPMNGTFTYTISDGNGGTDTATVSYKVWPSGGGGN